MASTMFLVIVLLTGTACMLQARSECSTTGALVVLAAVVLAASKHDDILDDCATGDEGKYPFLDAIAEDDEQWSDIGEQSFTGKVRVKRRPTTWEDERYGEKTAYLENDSQYKEHARTKQDFYDEYKYDGAQVYDDYEGIRELQFYDRKRTTPTPSTHDSGKRYAVELAHPPSKRKFKISEQDEQNMRIDNAPKNWEGAKILLNSNEMKLVQPMPYSRGFRPEVRKKKHYPDQNVFTNVFPDKYNNFYDYDTTKTLTTKEKCLPTKFAHPFAHDTSEKPKSHPQILPGPKLQHQPPKKPEPIPKSQHESLPRPHSEFLPQQDQKYPPQTRQEFPSQTHPEFPPQPHQELQLPQPIPHSRPQPELLPQPQSRPELSPQSHPNHYILPQTRPEFPPQSHLKPPPQSEPYPELLPESLPELPPQSHPAFSQKSRPEMAPQQPNLQPQPTTRSQPPHTVHQLQSNRQPQTDSGQPQSLQSQSLTRAIKSKPKSLLDPIITELTLYLTYPNKPWPKEEEELKTLKLPPVDFTMAETFKGHMDEYLKGTLAWNIVNGILRQTQVAADTRRQVRPGLPARTRYHSVVSRVGRGVAEEGLRRILEDTLQKVQELAGVGVGDGQSTLPENLASFLSWILTGSRDEALFPERTTPRTFLTDDRRQVASMARLLERLLSSHDALGPRELPMVRPQHDVVVGLYQRLRTYMETHTTTHSPLVRYDPGHDDDEYVNRRQVPWNFKVRHVWDEEPDRSHDYNKPQRS